MKPDSKVYFIHLDGLRFVLAFIVFGSHAMLGVTVNDLIHFELLNRFITVFTSGYLGVSFFFVLSGFLITYLMIEEREKTGSFVIRNFYVRRIFRIWPLYFFVLTFSFFIYPFIKTRLGFIDQNPFSFVYQFFFLANFDNIRVHEAGLVAVAPMMININWSVSIEEQFYLFWPIIFLIFKSKHFWISCSLVILISWGFRLTTVTANLYYHTLSVISDMAIGGLGACLLYYSKGFMNWIANLPKLLIATFYIIGCLFLMYYDLLLGDFFIRTSFRVLSGAFFCFIIIEQCYASQSWYKFGNFKKITRLGNYTYALYMLHPIGIQTSIVLFRFLNIQRDENFLYGILYVAQAFIISLMLSMFSYRYLESYFLEKRKLFY